MRTVLPIKLASIAGSAAVVLAVALAASPAPRASFGGQIPKKGGVEVPGAPGQGGTEASIAQQKTQRAPAPEGRIEGRAAPAFPPGVVVPPHRGGVRRGFVSVVGSFELAGPTGTGLYRWLEAPHDRRNPYRFWRSELAFEGRQPVLFGGAGSNMAAVPRPLDAFLYRDIASPFWLAFSAQPNPDGTWNIAFSLDQRSWYWWDDDARGFDPPGVFALPAAPARP